MIVFMIGDVVGPSGCAYLAQNTGKIRQKYQPDIIIANGENSAAGNGITQKSAKQLFDCGVDIITTGNHVLRRREIYEVLDKHNGLLRPANYHPSAPGSGIYYYDRPGFELCVINLQGVVYMQNLENPFDCADRLLKEVTTPNIIVDFHAEATAEKICMGLYLDGRVSAVIGTHTHVPTADGRILPGGTGYITDVGMCGSADSVLGVRAELAIERMRTGLPVRFETEDRNIAMNAVVLELDANGTCIRLEALTKI